MWLRGTLLILSRARHSTGHRGSVGTQVFLVFMTETRVYAGRLAGMMLMGPYGDSIGRVRDVVVTIYQHRSHVLGLVIALPNKRQIFLPMLRVASINPSEVMATSSSVNLKPFQSRSGEISIQHELVGSKVHTDDPEHAELHGQALEIVDVELKQSRTRMPFNYYLL